ncbi:MAG: GMC oxidoreductase, partial [Cytophagales bacterium]
PTEPKTDKPFPYQPIPVEPFTKELYENIHKVGVKAFPIPIAVNLKEEEENDSKLVLGNFDGFPDPTESKIDSHVYGVRVALKNKNVKLIKNALVKKLVSNEQGTEVKQVEVEIDGEIEFFSGDLVIVAGGAINSAALLLKSTSHKHPNGLGNAFDLVGRNYMSHINGCLIAFTPEKLNLAPFQKYFCIGDYYWGDTDYSYPLGEIQLMGKNDPSTYTYFAPESLKGQDAKYISQHAIDFWLTSEDIPMHDNRVLVTKENQIQLIYHREKNNVASFEKLKLKLKAIMEKVGQIDPNLKNITWDGYDLGISGVSHQCGTLKFGEKPENSVLDIHCKVHGVENLYVVDASFFVSCGAYNPSLTIAANALRVADYLKNQIL